MFALFSNLVRWSYGYNLLAKPRQPASSGENIPSGEETTSTTSDSSASANNRPQRSIRQVASEAHRRKSIGLGTDETFYVYEEEPKLPKRRPNGGSAGRVRATEHHGGSVLPGRVEAEPEVIEEEARDEDDERQPLLPPPVGSVQPALSWRDRIAAHPIILLAQKLLEPFANPPMIASIMGILFGLVPPLKSLIFGPAAPFSGLIGMPLRNCGEASVPLTLVGLGVTLRNTLVKQAERSRNPDISAAHPPGLARAVAWVLFARLILMTGIGLAIIYAAREFGVSLAKQDPLFVLTMLIIASSPTAVNLVQIASVGGAYEEELSICLLWTYGVALPIQIASCAGYLVLVTDLMKFERPLWA